jgi:Cu(I)/Ag(I) efflux system membrane fusion protein
MAGKKIKYGLGGLKVFLVVLLIIAAFGLGFIFRGSAGTPGTTETDAHSEAEQEQTIWTCSMHPQIRQPKPGKCPICFMDLIPLKESNIGEMRIEFSEAAKKLMQIETSPVERKFVTAKIRMVGKIDYDETRLKNISAWVPGRIDRLYVDYTGIEVRQGDHMVYLYSPELLEDQRALLAALDASKSLESAGSEFVKVLKVGNIEAVEKRLKLRGLTDEQIEQIKKTGKPVDHLTIYAPIGGIVIEKHANEGMYVQTGMKIYTIADLSQLWVKLDAYESDMMWIRYGQEVEFATEAYPGEVFKGRISFIDPTLNPKTHTVKLRVNVENHDGKLKPEMFVRALVNSRIAGGGMVMDENMAGKWICPMHPDIVKDAAGTCDICGMDLVTTESLGYVELTATGQAPLVVPASSVLITGKRAVVYVQVPDTEKPTYEGREIMLGPRAGDYYLVESGLREGEVVVTNGNFKIDSEMQLRAKPSMMNSEDELSISENQDNMQGSKTEMIEVPEALRLQLWQIYEGYMNMQKALAADDINAAAESAEQALQSLSSVDMNLLTGQANIFCMEKSGKIKKLLEQIKESEKIEAVREAFDKLSVEVIALVEKFGIPESQVLYKFHCPMAFDNKGADWIQDINDIKNPYFGTAMLKCGEMTEVIGN